MPEKKVLIAFDYDRTIIDGNMDEQIRGMCEDHLPSDVKDKYDEDDMTTYMDGVYSYLNSHNVSTDKLRSAVCKIPLTPGMDKLFELLAGDRYEVIVISGGNTLGIDWSLEHHGLKPCVSKVYSNPSYIDDNGRMKIERYHKQDWCDLSEKNLCKGRIKDSLSKRASSSSHIQLFVVANFHLSQLHT